MEELLEIEPPDDEMYHLRQNENVLGKPFFQVISNGEMEKADTSSRRLRELGVRTDIFVSRPSTTSGLKACTSLVCSHLILDSLDFSR